MTMNVVFMIFIILWELPQNIIGIVLYFLVKGRIKKKEIIKKHIFCKVTGFAISLGEFIFWTDDKNLIIELKQPNKVHEYGHAIQSKLLGPLYLIIIGIPSLGRNIYGILYYYIKKKIWRHYFDGYPEDWADKLGNKFFPNKECN